MDTTCFSKSGDEVTLEDIKRQILSNRKEEWARLFKFYSVVDENDDIVCVDDLESVVVVAEQAEKVTDDGADISSKDTSIESSCSADSDPDEDRDTKPTMLEMSTRWIAICSKKDKTNMCNVCSMQANSSTVENGIKNWNGNNRSNNNTSHMELQNVSKRQHSYLLKGEDNSKKLVDNSCTYYDKCRESDKNSKNKDRILIPDISTVSLQNNTCVTTEKVFVEEYIAEIGCEFSKNEILALISDIENKVGNRLKDLGLLLQSKECENDRIRYNNVKKQLAEVVRSLGIKITIKAMCLYGSYQSWKYQKNVSAD